MEPSATAAFLIGRILRAARPTRINHMSYCVGALAHRGRWSVTFNVRVGVKMVYTVGVKRR